MHCLWIEIIEIGVMIGESAAPVEVTPEMVANDITPEILKNRELFLNVIERKFLKALEKKEEANAKFSKTDYEGAIQSYREGLLLISFENFQYIDSPEVRANILDLFKKMLNNTSQCFIAMERWDDALEVCDKVTKLDPSELKSYYRAGLCLRNMGKLRESYARLEKGSELAKSVNITINPEYITLKNEIAKQIKEDREKEKVMYQGMFEGKKPTQGKPGHHKHPGKHPLLFPLVGGISGACTYFALQALPATQSLKEEDKVAISAGVGTGLGGLSTSESTAVKVLSAGSVLAGLGFLAYRLMQKGN